MPAFLTDDQVAALEKPKKLISDEEMATLEQSADDYARQTDSVLRSTGKAGLEAVGAVSNFTDRFGGGASSRAAIGAAQEGKPIGAAFANQFLQDPSTAPSGKQIAAKAGLSEEEFRTPIIMNPFTMERFKVSPAGIAGGALETGLDPAGMLLPGAIESRALKSGLGLVEKYAPRMAEGLGRFAEERAVKAATGENRAAIKKLARVKGQSAGDVDRAVSNLRKTGRTLLEPDEAGAPAGGWFSNAEEIGRNAAAKRQFYGKKIEEVGNAVEKIAPNSIIGSDLAKDLTTYSESIPNVGKGANLRSRLAEEAGRFNDLGPISFKQAQDIKGQFPYEPQAADVLISDKDVTNRIHGIIGSKMDLAASRASAPKPEVRPSAFGSDLHKGKPSIDIDGGFSLVQRNKNEITYSKSPVSRKEAWDIIDKNNDKTVGTIFTETDKGTGVPFVRQSNVIDEYRNKGLGTKAYDKLARHYGRLDSDYNAMSDSAKKVYDKLGAETLAEENAAGSARRSIKRQAPSEEDMATLNQYGPAKEKYGIYKNVADAGTEQALRTLGRRMVSPSSHALGAATGIAAAGDLATKGLYGAAAAGVNQALLSRGSAFAARSADAISKKLMQAPGLYQKWLPTMQKAAKAGNAVVMATHHQLMNNDADYRRLMLSQDQP